MDIESTMGELIEIINNVVTQAENSETHSEVFVDFTVCLAGGAYDMRKHRAEIEPEYSHWMLVEGVMP